MSSGDCHDNCADVIQRAFEYLDGEMDPAEGERIRRHLEECAPCLHEYDVDTIMKALVRRSCGQERAPAALRTQIMARITLIRTSSITVSVQPTRPEAWPPAAGRPEWP